jgi:hypothetical protein
MDTALIEAIASYLDSIGGERSLAGLTLTSLTEWFS